MSYLVRMQSPEVQQTLVNFSTEQFVLPWGYAEPIYAYGPMIKYKLSYDKYYIQNVSHFLGRGEVRKIGEIHSRMIKEGKTNRMFAGRLLKDLYLSPASESYFLGLFTGNFICINDFFYKDDEFFEPYCEWWVQVVSGPIFKADGERLLWLNMTTDFKEIYKNLVGKGLKRHYGFEEKR
jgi:hypothetical protein